MTKIIIDESKMVSVDSSFITAIGTIGDNLLVRFDRVGTYVYGSGSAKLFNQMLTAPSKGKFVNFVLKPAYTGILIIR